MIQYLIWYSLLQNLSNQLIISQSTQSVSLYVVYDTDSLFMQIVVTSLFLLMSLLDLECFWFCLFLFDLIRYVPVNAPYTNRLKHVYPIG